MWDSSDRVPNHHVLATGSVTEEASRVGQKKAERSRGWGASEKIAEAMRPLVLLVSTVTPAGITYGPPLEEIEADVRAEVKDLEVLAEDVPPPG